MGRYIAGFWGWGNYGEDAECEMRDGWYGFLVRRGDASLRFVSRLGEMGLSSFDFRDGVCKHR